MVDILIEPGESVLEAVKALERIKRLSQRTPQSPEHAVLNGIAEAIIECGERSIPVWLEEQHQQTLEQTLEQTYQSSPEE